MSTSWRPNGYNFAPEYQVSGWPFVKTVSGVDTTAQKIEFPRVTRWFSISIHSTAHRAVRVGFTENGVNDTAGDGHYFLIETDEKDGGGGGANHSFKSSTFEIKCKELWFRTDSGDSTTVSVIAGYTGVLTGSFPVITGSNGFEGVG